MHHLVGILAVLFYSLFSPFIGNRSDSLYSGAGHRDASFWAVLRRLFMWIIFIFLFLGVLFTFTYGDDTFSTLWGMIGVLSLYVLLPCWIIFSVLKKVDKSLNKKPRKIYTAKDIISGKHMKR